MQLSDLLTQNQIQNLKAIGITTIYDLITYLPLRLVQIQPLDLGIDSTDTIENLEIQFLLETKVINVEASYGAKKHTQITTQRTDLGKLYYFGYINKYSKNLQFQPDLTYQFLLKYKYPFWQILKFREKQATLESKEFTLGRAEIKTYLLPKYSKNKTVLPGYFNLLHKRLPDSAYSLNLAGLVPPDTILPQVLNLKGLHKPSDYQDYQQTLRQWNNFQAFLILAKHKYLAQNKTEILIDKPKLDLEYLKQLTNQLDFDLSTSQKQAIWQILTQITQTQ